MGRFNPAPYSPHLSFVATKAFTYASVRYRHGDVFPSKDVPEHRLRQLFDARMIGPKGFGDGPKPAYIENGKGLADKLSAELAREEAEAAQRARAEEKAKAGGGNGPAHRAAPAKTASANAKKSAAAAPPPAGKKVVAKPAAKSLRAKRSA